MTSKIYAKLSEIQAELKAPKSQYNEFGKYKYRKAEDILEAVKPYLHAHGCTLTCTDELMLVGDRYYIKATATLTCIEDGSEVSTNAYAREEEEKKGMDGSQVTGASSSYARKYALNGLLCIDDTADSDTTNTGETAQKPRKPAGKEKPAPKVEKAPQPKETASTGQQQEPTRETWVKWIAEGAKNKAGVSAFDLYVSKYHPTEEDLAELDSQVLRYRLDHGIKANLN